MKVAYIIFRDFLSSLNLSLRIILFLPLALSGMSTLFEPRHEISNNVVCATSKGSDQPVHTRSLIRASASRLNIL